MNLQNLKISNKLIIEGETLRRNQELYRVLKNKTVKDIIEFIESQQPTPVYSIVHALRIEQCVVSQFLMKLRRFDLVTGKRSGKEVLYSINRVTFNDVKEVMEIVTPEQMHALCNNTRLDILQLLIDKIRHLSVTEIYTGLKIEQSVASKHLSILYGACLVDYTKEGKEHLYFPVYSQLEKIHTELEVFQTAM